MDPDCGHLPQPPDCGQTAITMHQLAAELKSTVGSECAEVARRMGGAATWTCSGLTEKEVEDGLVLFEPNFKVKVSSDVRQPVEESVDFGGAQTTRERLTYQFDISGTTEPRTEA